jgi:hypothetical protein
MDRISHALTLPELGLRLGCESNSAHFGILYIPYDNKWLDIPSVNLLEFSRLMRSAGYAAAFYGICGSSYVDATDITTGFVRIVGDVAEFAVFEGLEAIYTKRVDLLKACREIGRLSLWIDRQPISKGDRTEIGAPHLHFDTSELPADFGKDK